MNLLNIDLKQINIIPAEKENKKHRREVWRIYNENLEVNIITHEPVQYKKHCKWWETAFENEYIFIILHQTSVCGYIRLTKRESNSKEKYVISTSLAKKFQHSGIGTYAYILFEAKMKEIGVNQLIALTVINNEGGQKFFKKNGFKMTGFDKENKFKRYIKKL